MSIKIDWSTVFWHKVKCTWFLQNFVTLVWNMFLSYSYLFLSSCTYLREDIDVHAVTSIKIIFVLRNRKWNLRKAILFINKEEVESNG